ncbi:dihydrolipoyl dehydrogenase [Azospirillum doebereinerae]
MSARIAAKLLVVGGGPGGYVAAIRAGQLGIDTVLVEAERLGGACLNRGCIPSKALIHAAARFHAMTETAEAGALGITLPQPPTLDLAATMRWKDGIVGRLNTGVAALLKKAGVRVVEGWAVFSDAKTCTVRGTGEPVTITADHVVLANGSEPVALPALPFGGAVISSTEALALQRLPKRLVVVGGGYIGLELGTAFRRLGAEVTVVEAQDRILPTYDEPLTEPVRRSLERMGVTVLTGARALGMAEGEETALTVRARDGEVRPLPADAVLVTVGRRPRLEGWGFERMAIDRDGPFVKVDDQCRTSMRNVWAIGDLVGEPMLAHKASAQGAMVAEIIAGHRRRFDPAAIPAVCFTEPEIVSVGLTAAQAADQGIETATGQFPFLANGRALSMDAGQDSGFVRTVARRDDGRLLGVQAVGMHISELSGAFVLALEMGATLEDIANTIHAHPTLGEAFHESTLKALGHGIHV